MSLFSILSNNIKLKIKCRDHSLEKIKMLKRAFGLPAKLGRWKIEHDMKIINIKIDQANKDNSFYHFEKEKEPSKEPTEMKNDFLLPYCI